MYYDLTAFINGVRMPVFDEINYRVIEREPIEAPYIEDPNINPLSITDQYFQGKIKEDTEAKEQKLRIQSLPLEERIRYESQQQFIKDKSDVKNLDIEALKLEDYKRNRQIYNELRELSSDPYLNSYSIFEPTLQQPYMNFHKLIETMSGRSTDSENDETQRIMKILYRYAYKGRAYNGPFPLKFVKRGATFDIVPSRDSSGRFVTPQRVQFETRTPERVPTPETTEFIPSDTSYDHMNLTELREEVKRRNMKDYIIADGSVNRSYKEVGLRRALIADDQLTTIQRSSSSMADVVEGAM
jgi:hypothetical protein